MKLIKYFFLICFITAFYSCTKDLDLVPKNRISDGSFWKTEVDFEKAANFFYWRLDVHQVGTEADLVYQSSNPISNGTYLASDDSDDWEKPYEGIRSTTYLIEKAVGSPVEDDIQCYVGEALFFRALEYYRLVKTYGDVPLITESLDIDSEELYSSRTDRTLVVDFILADLDKAIPLLPKQSEVPSWKDGRITSGAALALKARVALYEGTWQKYHGTNTNVDKYLDAAINASNSVITSGEYVLFTDPVEPENSFFRLYDVPGDGSSEVIVASRFAIDIRTTSFSWTYDQVRPTKKLADMFLCTDGLPIDQSPLFGGYSTMISEFADRDPRMAQTMLISGTPHYADNWFEFLPYYNLTLAGSVSGYIMRKADTQDLNAIQTWAKDVMDFKMIRYAEVLLIYAEATFERNGSISDADLNKSINVVRKRAGIDMLDLTNAFVSANGLDMKTEIRRERTIELAVEGFRFDDLKRWKTAETEMPMEVRGVKYEGTEFETNYPLTIGVDIFVDGDGFKVLEYSSARVFDEQKHYLFPLPLVELQLNKNLIQNPGW